MNRLLRDSRCIAVIGSGFGGLAAAIRLQAAGFETVLFEARDKPGGRAYVYEDRGFVFDAGPTVITAPSCLDELFAAADRRLADYVELIAVTPFYRLLWEDGDRIDYAGADSLRAQIAERNGEDLAGYERFLAFSRQAFQRGYQELAAEPFLRFSDMVRCAPSLVRLRADRSVYATVSRFVRDPHLREALSFHSLLVGGNPLDTSSLYSLIHYLETTWGVWFPRGGTGALVRAMAGLFVELGGSLQLGTPVDRIDVERRADGAVHHVHTGNRTRRFDAVVSNSDLYHTYSHLYASEPHANSVRRRLDRMDWSMSLFVLYFGVRGTYPDLAHHTVLFGPRYRELLSEIFHGNALPKDFSLYLHAPSVTDASLAPEGSSAFYVLSPVPHLGRADVDWERIAPRYAERILAYLERYIPGLDANLVTHRFFTPFDFRDELRARHGSAFSLSPKLTQSAWFRPHNKDPRIPGLYLVGAGTHPGAGLPGVVNSAKATARLVISDLKTGEAQWQGRAAFASEP